MSTRDVIRSIAKGNEWELRNDPKLDFAQRDVFIRPGEAVSVFYKEGARVSVHIARHEVDGDPVQILADVHKDKKGTVIGWLQAEPIIEAETIQERHERERKELLDQHAADRAALGLDETDGQPVADLTATATEVIHTDVINEVMEKSGLYQSIPKAPRIKDDQDINGIIHLIAYLAGTADRLAEEVQQNIEIRNTIRGYLGTI